MASKYDQQAATRQRAISSIIRDTQELRESIADGDMANAKMCIDAIKQSRRFFETAVDSKMPSLADADQARFTAAWGDYLDAAEPILAEQRAAKERAANAATDAQVDYLRILGYTGSTKDLTKREASSLIDSLKSRNGHRITAEDNDDPEAFESVRRALL